MTQRLPWLALFVVVGCASTKGLDRPIKGVKVEGNEAFKDKEIVTRLAMRPPQGLIVKKVTDLDPIALQLDRKRVEAFYRERGYFDARVTDVDVQKEDDGKDVRITITVEEGEPTRVAALEVHGTEADFARGVITDETKLRAGNILDHPEYLIAKDTLEKALVKEGYAHAEVEGTVEVDRNARRAVIKLTANPGPLVKFGKVKIEGAGRVPESAVKNRIAWDEGDVFDPEKIQTTEGRLYGMGTFASVRSDWVQEGNPEISDITIKVSEGARHEVRLGFGAGVDRARWELRTRAGFTQRRFLGSPLTTFRADATPAYAWLRSDGSHGPSIEVTGSVDRQDLLLLPRVTGTVLGAFQREPREGYTLSGPRANLSVERPFFDDDSLQVHVGWEFRYLSFLDFDPMVFGPAATASRLAYFEQRVVYDRRDVPLDARHGFYAELGLNEGGTFAGGQEEFLKTTAELRGYLPIPFFKRIVLAGRASGGRLRASGNETPLPVRFYGGGATDHRGFGFHRLSPQRRDAEGKIIPVGGDDYVLVTAEARIDLFKFKEEWFSTAIFLDGGDSVSPPGALDLGNLHWAAGIGVRYNTLIGPVRADFGIRLNRTGEMGSDGLGNPDPGSAFAFHLSLGEAF